MALGGQRSTVKYLAKHGIAPSFEGVGTLPDEFQDHAQSMAWSLAMLKNEAWRGPDPEDDPPAPDALPDAGGEFGFLFRWDIPAYVKELAPERLSAAGAVQ
jgi:hypothetical protein